MHATGLPPDVPHTPPPPKRSRRGLWIGIVAAVLVLCLCCISLAVVIWVERDKIGLNNLFGTSVPSGQLFTDPASGISLYYPADWEYTNDNGVIVFASSQEILDNVNASPSSGAAMAIMTSLFDESNLPAGISSRDPLAILNYAASAQVSGSFTPLQQARTLTIGSYPAASGVYQTTNEYGQQEAAHLTVIIKAPQIILAAGICPLSELGARQPQFEGILKSIRFQPAE